MVACHMPHKTNKDLKNNINKKLAEYSTTRQQTIKKWFGFFYNTALTEHKKKFVEELQAEIQEQNSENAIFCLLYHTYHTPLSYKTKDNKDKTCTEKDGNLGNTLYECMESIIFSYRNEGDVKEFINQCKSEFFSPVTHSAVTNATHNETTAVSIKEEATSEQENSRIHFTDFVLKMFDEIQDILAGGLVY